MAAVAGGQIANGCRGGRGGRVNGCVVEVVMVPEALPWQSYILSWT